MGKKLGKKFYRKLGEFIQLATDCTIIKENGRVVTVNMTLSDRPGGASYDDIKWVAEKLRHSRADFTIEIMRENVPSFGSLPMAPLVASQFERDMMQDFILNRQR